MMPHLRIYGLVVFLLAAFSAAAQDSSEVRGSIKVRRGREELRISASAKFTHYEITEDQGILQLLPPAPLAESSEGPFDYTAFFSDYFKKNAIALKDRETDTVRIYLRVSKKGKAVFSDQLPFDQNPARPQRPEQGPDVLRAGCLKLLQSVPAWNPPVALLTRKTTFKKQTVIKPLKKKVNADGVITIIFSKGLVAE